MSKFAYVDSSIVVGLLLNEKESQRASKTLGKFDYLISSDLLVAEVYSAASRENLILSDCLEFLNTINIILPDQSLTMELQKILQSGYLRGADAFHLACALWYSKGASIKIVFATADKRQAEMAKLLGFKVLT